MSPRYSINKTSVTQNVVILIKSLNEAEIEDFIVFAEKGKRDSAYLKLFLEIVKTKEESDEKEYDYKLKTLAENGDELEPAFTDRYDGLILSLQKKLFAWVGQEYEKSIHAKWRIDFRKGLLEVEGLMERELFDLAAIRLLDLDKIRPQPEGLKGRDDLSLFSWIHHLRLQLEVKVEIDLKVDEDDFIKFIYSMGNLIRPSSTQNDQKVFDIYFGQFNQVFPKEAEAQMLFEFMGDFLERKGNRKAKSILLKHQLESIKKQYDSLNDDQDTFLPRKKEIGQLLLIKFYLTHMELFYLQLSTRGKAIDGFIQYVDSLPFDPVYLGPALICYIENQVREFSLAADPQTGDTVDQMQVNRLIDLPSPFYRPDVIPEPHLRMEFNHAITLFTLENYKEAQDIAEILKKKKVLPVETGLFILITEIEMGQIGIDSKVKKYRNLIKKETHPFEWTITGLFATLYKDGGFPDWLNGITYTHIEKYDSLEELAKPISPLHQLARWWLAKKLKKHQR